MIIGPYGAHVSGIQLGGGGEGHEPTPAPTIPLTGLMFRKRIELTLRKTRIETDRPWEDRLFGKY